MSVSLTAYSVAVLSIQRYRITADPLQAFTSSQPTWRGSGATICGLWVVSALIAIPKARFTFSENGYSFFRFNNYYLLLTVFNLLESCVLPLFVIAFCYIMTARHLVKSYRSVPGEIKNPQQNTRKITAKILLGLTGVFVISYLPVHITEIILCIRMDESWIPSSPDVVYDKFFNIVDTYMMLSCFLPLNSCLYPVALFCTSTAFRTHLKRYLTCCCKTNPPPTDSELPRRN
jgi:hypothetical protein